MEDYNLRFVYKKGANWNDDEVSYQLLFSTDTEFSNFDDDSWGLYPSMGRAVKPIVESVSKIITFSTELRLELAQDSPYHSMYDAMDGVTPLAYEYVLDYEVLPEIRLVLHYDAEYDKVIDMLNMLNIEYDEEVN